MDLQDVGDLFLSKGILKDRTSGDKQEWMDTFSNLKRSEEDMANIWTMHRRDTNTNRIFQVPTPLEFKQDMDIMDYIILTNTTYEFEGLHKRFNNCSSMWGLGRDSEQGILFNFYSTRYIFFTLVQGYKGQSTTEGLRVLRVFNKTAPIINTGTAGGIKGADIYLLGDESVRVPLNFKIVEWKTGCVFTEGEDIKGAKRLCFDEGFERKGGIEELMKVTYEDRRFNEDVMTACRDLEFSCLEGALYTSNFKLEMFEPDLEKIRASNFACAWIWSMEG